MDSEGGRDPLLAVAGQSLDPAQYRDLVDSAPDALVLVDPDGKILLVNLQVERLFGYPRAELLGQRVELLVPEPFRGLQASPRDAGSAPESQVGATGVHLDLTGRRKDGSEFPVEISLSHLDRPEGVLVAAIRDATDRRRANNKFRDLLESAPDAMVIIDGRGTIRLVNAQAKRLFGYQRAALVGKPVEVLIPERLRGRHAAHRDGYFASPKVRGMGAGLELWGLHREGREFPIEISLSPLQTEDGVWATAAVRDISARKKAEQRFRALLETAPDAMVIIDRAGCIVLVNVQAERLFGHSREKMIGQRVEMLIPERLRERHGEHRVGYFGAPKVREMGAGLELWGLRSNGEEFAIEISLSPMGGDDDLLATAAVRDISDRKAVERKLARVADDLARSNRDLEQFAFVASHDLQAPLRSVIGFSQLLRRKYHEQFDQDGREFLDFVEGSARHMQALVNGLLDFSRVGSQGPDFVEIDTEVVLAKVVSQLSATLGERSGHVTHDPLPRLVASELEFNQLMQNLIVNGLKFQPGPEPRVHISARRIDSGWEFSVRDWGIGISLEHQERIFQIFQRLHSPEEYSGTGIGLAVCQKIVQRHGGRIWVDSRAGEGATFHFTIAPEA